MLVRRMVMVFRSHPASCPPARKISDVQFYVQHLRTRRGQRNQHRQLKQSGQIFLGDFEIFLYLTFSRWGGVGRLRVASSAQGVSLRSVLIIEAVEVLGGGAVEVEPPVADEVVLVEESSVGAEEAVLGEAASSVSGADVESLALGLGVRVVTYREKCRKYR